MTLFGGRRGCNFLSMKRAVVSKYIQINKNQTDQRPPTCCMDLSDEF